MTPTAPDEPAGELEVVETYDAAVRARLTDELRTAPTELRAAVDGLDDARLDTRYRNWTIRQIVHHLADSHVHSYVRFKWTLTEPNPTIKAYEEADWVEVEDARTGAIEPALLLFKGLHAKWVQTIEAMTEEQFARTFVHPQTGETVSLWTALNYYPWHGRHHTGQIRWLRTTHGW